MFKKVLQTIAAAMTLCLTMHLAMASEIVKVPTAWLGEHEAFLMWKKAGMLKPVWIFRCNCSIPALIS